VRLVDLDAVTDHLEVEWGYEGIREDLYSLPVVDVAPVVQGSGKVRATDEAETTQIIDGCCTACGAFMDYIEAADYKFCPYCAKRVV
jgi:hypothetical protein